MRSPKGCYYNEIDEYAASWLRNLIAAGLIPAGDVDTRDIRDVRPIDLRGYVSCHFFAGIGGWPVALRLAGWPDERPVWSGSCPCQAHSHAARGRNVAADLWEPFFGLLVTELPGTVFGEQVASAGTWFDGVCDDLEALDYSVGAAILPACSVGKDHARPRIYFVGHANGDREPELSVDGEMDWVPGDRSQPRSLVSSNGVPRRMAVMHAFGNAIVPQVAAEFIKAYLATRPLDSAA